jgi:hypothetical protein
MNFQHNFNTIPTQFRHEHREVLFIQWIKILIVTSTFILLYYVITKNVMNYFKIIKHRYTY